MDYYRRSKKAALFSAFFAVKQPNEDAKLGSYLLALMLSQMLSQLQQGVDR
jgi:hypothetical protein